MEVGGTFKVAPSYSTWTGQPGGPVAWRPGCFPSQAPGAYSSGSRTLEALSRAPGEARALVEGEGSADARGGTRWWVSQPRFRELEPFKCTWVVWKSHVARGGH